MKEERLSVNRTVIDRELIRASKNKEIYICYIKKNF